MDRCWAAWVPLIRFFLSGRGTAQEKLLFMDHTVFRVFWETLCGLCGVL